MHALRAKAHTNGLPAFSLGRFIFLVRAYKHATPLDGYDAAVNDFAPGGDHFGQGTGLQNGLFHTIIMTSTLVISKNTLVITLQQY